MTKKQRAAIIIERLREAYPDATCTLEYDEAWKLLVEVRLAAQCTDARVNIVTKDLFQKYTSVDAFADADLKELEQDIKPTGFYRNKAKNIIACMKDIREKFGGEVPRRRPVAEGTGEAPRRRPVAVESNDTNAYRRYREDYPERAYGKRKRGSFSKGVLVLLIGIAAGVLIGINLNLLHSKPDAIEAFDRKLDLGVSEVTNLSYETYWNFVYSSYIVLGDDRETAQLYKISDKVPRHNLDMENFVTGDDGYLHYSSEDISDTKVGIDVSSYQGDIDWKAVADSRNIDFAMIRVGYRGYGSEGKLDTDSRYEDNLKGAQENKVPMGVYFFTEAINYDEGVEEANYVLSLIEDYNVTYPVVIDTEYVNDSNARANDISNSDRTDAIVGFCETIKASGHTPMIYASRNWFVQNMDIDRLGEYELWVAQYANVPYFPYKFTGWQYTYEGSVPGIEAPVDINVWFD